MFVAKQTSVNGIRLDNVAVRAVNEILRNTRNK